MNHAKPSEPDDPTRARRMAYGAAAEYFRLSREHWSEGRSNDAQTFALQGILRALMYHLEGDV